ncbi:aspartate-semialdehyde dehydrogenase (asd) [Pyrobaculum aerophilum str. IM2]|uniref:Aspartate-semialdehyde dehydrogenase (Asd) n=2 Tax=Pyrobaculum aerophilum TaxID=13773 RepID=Q8ZUA4_PYRAE|nr:aspartate-semialdehyde dehydrogenase [Pyrobaculum aerophilum]AAL64504.1 aspartate-semialdehyde dehydrogenase (asd) [Pyrobaculum aerophilum str. IM2]HII47349.1 aspartate-semialdehyde dehydrogenase [Pyrobaculum aerophilum]
MDRYKVYILGATGLVGQRYVQLLARHPWFEIVGMAASEKSAGKRLAETGWVLEEPPPPEVAEMRLEKLEADKVPKVDFVFSALPSEVAAKVEPELAAKGYTILSNSSNMRMEPDVPLVIPEVNPEDLSLVEKQKAGRGWRGAVVKKPNCTTTILNLPLKPILDEWGIERVHVVTMQALSGAGYAGVPSVAIMDNIIPYIKGEEEKVVAETRKILKADFDVYVTTTRAPVLDGHLEVVYVDTKRDFGLEAVADSLERFRGLPQELKLPTAPEKPIEVKRQIDRPQPRLDRWAGKGMAVVVGRLRKLSPRKLAMVVLGHNTVRGAAGNSVLTAELMIANRV